MPKRSEFNTRPCTVCGELVIDVRDAFTHATFPVDAEAITYPGLVLTPADDPRKNPYAHRGDLFVPHLPDCQAPEGELDITPPNQEGESPTEEDPDAE